MDRTDLTIDDIRMALELVKHRSVHLHQELHARLEAPPQKAMDHKMDIPDDDRGLPDSSTSFRRSSATYPTAHSRPLSLPNTPIPAISPPPICEEGVPRTLFTIHDSSALRQGPNTTLSQSSGFFCSCVRVQETILTPFSRVVKYKSYGF